MVSGSQNPGRPSWAIAAFFAGGLLSRTLLSIVLVSVLLISPDGGATSAQLAPFATDGCSAFPDGTVNDPELWRHCCVAHDWIYWAGGTRADRLNADEALSECVAKGVDGTPGQILARAMLEGVQAGGHPNLPTSWRWGYGWPFPFEFGPLTPAQLAAVRQRKAEHAAGDVYGCGEASVTKASLLLISDVDDTIKISRLRSRAPETKSAPRKENGVVGVMQKLFGASTVDRALAKAETLQNVRRSGRFLGMAELYAMLRAQHPGMAIHYLSNAPDTLVGRYHRRFIREASFPVGHCHFRSAVDILTRVEHKRETIDRLTLRRPTTVILIGDNGESDPDIYAQASTRLRKAGVRTLVYIRQAYPPSQTPQWTGPRDDQIEFVTPVEVALHLIGEGMLDDAQVQSFADKWSQQIAREASWAVGQNHPTSDISRFLPEWMGCDGFEWPTPTGSQWPAIETIVGSLAGRCTNMTRAKRKH